MAGVITFRYNTAKVFCGWIKAKAGGDKASICMASDELLTIIRTDFYCDIDVSSNFL
jgi:hypothetical protein